MRYVPPINGLSNILPVPDSNPTTTKYINNVRPMDSLEKRLRLGQRPGLDKWGAGTQIGSSVQPVVSFCTVSSII